MSSRALRRLQREEAERKQLEEDKKDSEEDDDYEQERPSPKGQNQRNAFNFLIAEEQDGEPSEDDDQVKEPDKKSTDPSILTHDSTKSKKKGKKKRKKLSKTATPEPEIEQDLDEIDQALKSLSTGNSTKEEATQVFDQGLRTFYQILSTDSKHLNPLNEMKKLFGSTVLDSNRGTTEARRHGRGTTQLDLGAALTGRHSQVSRGQGLAGLALRRNALMVGKEEWPKATSGGLGMMIVEEATDFTVEYKFVHSSMYQSIQRQFDLCVETMDPQRMISHLQLNPYHISTLLQVSEIAKHQGDHAFAVDLLERALFTFGRSIHSSFSTSMAIGKARLDFRRPENREFWLAAYRYVGTLGQRGTWRTAFEWAKLILSLDPEQDPYNIRLIIDQLAIRSAQYDTLVELAETPTDVLDWGQKMPNVQISLAMAYYKLKKLEQAQKTLRDIISLHPWVLANLYQELSIETIPNSVWARQPRTNREKLSTLSYGLRAKDIWNTPEAVSFLQSVVEAAKRDEPPIPATDPEEMELSMADCRHILLSETPTLMALLPRDIFNHRSSASDPVPPSDEIRSYNLNTSETISNDPEQDLQAEHLEAGNTESWFSSVLQRLGLVPNPVTNENDPAVNQQIAAAPETPETDINGIAQRSDSVNELDDFFRSERRISAQEQTPQEASTELQIHQHQNLPSESPQLNAPLQPSVEDDPDDEQPHLPASNTSHEQQPLLSPSTTYNDEANQRWLAGRGMLRLKDFISQHGPDENKWRDDLEIDITPATEYAHRITLLESRASREFILKYALQQGAGTQASELVRRLLE